MWSAIGPIIEPLAYIPVLDNPKFIRSWFSQLKRVKELINLSDSQMINAIPLRVKGQLLNFLRSDFLNTLSLEEKERELTVTYLLKNGEKKN